MIKLNTHIIWFNFFFMASCLFCSPDGFRVFFLFFRSFCRLSYTALCWESYNLFKAGQEQLSAELYHTVSIGETEHQSPKPVQPLGFEKACMSRIIISVYIAFFISNHVNVLYTKLRHVTKGMI